MLLSSIILKKQKAVFTVKTSTLNTTLTQRGCYSSLSGSCEFFNSFLCSLNGNSTCSCGICSDDRCNNDTIITTSSGDGNNYTQLLNSYGINGFAGIQNYTQLLAYFFGVVTSGSSSTQRSTTSQTVSINNSKSDGFEMKASIRLNVFLILIIFSYLNRKI